MTSYENRTGIVKGKKNREQFLILTLFFCHDFKQHAMSYDSYGLAWSFIAKLLRNSLYGSRTHQRKQRPSARRFGKFSRATDLNFDLKTIKWGILLQSVIHSLLPWLYLLYQLRTILNCACDKILIDWVRSGRTGPMSKGMECGRYTVNKKIFC